MTWSDGYNVDVEYEFLYIRELSPVLQRFMALLYGYELPPVSEEDVHMELAIGQGLTINMHAAVTPGSFIGNDFHPSHALYAQRLAQRSQIDIEITDESFAQMAARDDLPMCNSIGLHGVWTWISEENREHILTIIKRCLKPGGVVYNSYNLSAGNVAFEPWRDMMRRHFEEQQGSPVQKFDATIAYFKEVFESSPYLLENNPILKNKWQRISTGNRKNYLLQEYFNGHWRLFNGHEVAAHLAEAKLTFMGMTSGAPYLYGLSLPLPMKKHVQPQSDPLMAESWQNLFTNSTFRQELYIKGGCKISQIQLLERLKACRFIMVVSPENFTNQSPGSDSDSYFNIELFNSLKQKLLENQYAPKTFEQLLEAVGSQFNWLNLIQIIIIKMNMQQLQVCAEDVNDVMYERARRLNHIMLESIDTAKEHHFFVSPTTGQGVPVSYIFAVALGMIWENSTVSNDEIALSIWNSMILDQRRLMNGEGKILIEQDEHIAHTLQMLEEMRAKLPLFQQLGLL